MDLLPAAWCAARINVSKQLFRYWITKGHITPADHGADGRPLYSVEDALDLDARMRRTRPGRRRATAKIRAELAGSRT